jgi:uncharacterized membrane protein
VARYYFDTHDGDDLVADDEGQDLDGLASVRAEALEALASIAKDAVPKANRDAMMISVRDEAGEVVFRATLSLVIEPHIR